MNTIKVLDHGFVTLRNLAGPTRRSWIEKDLRRKIIIEREFDADDVDPANAARMSFDQMDSDRTYEQEMRLNRYLLANEHTSPFEMIQVWLEVKVPIFVDRQMVRHRTWARNETSARYVELPAEWYIPKVVGGKAANKKQGQEDNLPPDVQSWFRKSLQSQCERSYTLYSEAIQKGVAPEHARMLLHVNHYVHWVGTVNLANLFRFLKLRAHSRDQLNSPSHAQIEAQVYAEAIISLLRPHLPGLMGLFDELVRK